MSHASALSGLLSTGVGTMDGETRAAPKALASSSGRGSKSDGRAASGAAADAPEIDIDRFRQGDPDTFGVVLKRFGPLIRSIVAAYRPDPDESDDLYQDICMRVWERRTQFSGRGSLLGWINAIAHNVCRNWAVTHRRRELRETSFTPETIGADEIADLVEDPSQLAANEEFMDHLSLKLAALPKRQAQAFILVRVLGFSAKDAAAILGKFPATVRSNVRHAIKKLRRSMGVYKNGLS